MPPPPEAQSIPGAPAPQDGAARWLKLGRIATAHGIKGWLKVQSYTLPPEALMTYQPWWLRAASGTRQVAQVTAHEWDGRTLRVALAGVSDRTAAERLRGLDIEVQRAMLPEAGAHEHYCEDLLGFAVITLQGAALGMVRHFIDAPTSPVMVVAGEREHWIPAVPAHLRRVDRERREVWVDWPESL